MVLYDPWLIFPRELFPKDEKLANNVIRRMTLFPAFKHRLIVFMWLILHLQHTTAPLHTLGEFLSGTMPSPPVLSMGAEMAVVALAGLGYLACNQFAWMVRDFPPYPVQARVHARGAAAAIGFYAVCLSATLVFALMARQARVAIH